jgi:hypothetical protein
MNLFFYFFSTFGAFATNPQLAQKIKINFALAPVTTVRYITRAVCGFAYISPAVYKV